jgi:chitinase
MNMRKFFFSVLLLVSIALAAQAQWPARVFAPYMYIGQGDSFKLTDGNDACGLKYYTLAFIIARQQGGRTNTTYFPEPSWDGHFPMSQNIYQDQIEAIRKRGGDVIMSFGGEGGRELALVEENPAALQAAYQGIIDRYHFTWLDFDIEGRALDAHPEASQRRNTAVAALQATNPALIVSFTLPVDPDGLSQASLALLADAKAKGVKVHSANIMVMYFGRKFVGKGKSEAELSIASANKAHEQLQKIDPTIEVGLCPCLEGMPDGEVFTLEDAKTLKTFADQTPWVCSLHYWSINEDAHPRVRRAANNTNSVGGGNTTVAAPRQPWSFANIFKSFTR